MLGTNVRKIKILGAGWLFLGGIFLALAFAALLSVVIGDDPATWAFESGEKWWVVVLVLAAVGAIPTVNGLTLLRRNPAGRPVLAISSLVLFIPSAVAVVAGMGVLFLLVVVPSLWLTLSRGGKRAFESYMARENG